MFCDENNNNECVHVGGKGYLIRIREEPELCSRLIRQVPGWRWFNRATSRTKRYFILFMSLLAIQLPTSTTFYYFFVIRPSSNLLIGYKHENLNQHPEFMNEIWEYTRTPISDETITIVGDDLQQKIQRDTLSQKLQQQHKLEQQHPPQTQTQQQDQHQDQQRQATNSKLRKDAPSEMDIQEIHQSNDHNVKSDSPRDSNTSSLSLSSLMASIQMQSQRSVRIAQTIETDIKFNSSASAIENQQQPPQEQELQQQQHHQQEDQKLQATYDKLREVFKDVLSEIDSSNNTNPIFYQKMWSRNDLVKLLDTPECSAAIEAAKRRMPRSVAICPLCTAGHISDVYPYPIQYIKVPKAGSSTIVRYLTNHSQIQRIGRTLCTRQPHTDIRFSIIRDPLTRVYSAYTEVDNRKKEWLNSSKVTYRQYGYTGNIEPTARFLHFLVDYFNSYLESWDCGMPHHMVGAALHFDALRTESDGVTKNNLLLPDIVGRLEHLDDFLYWLRHILRQVHQFEANSTASTNDITVASDGGLRANDTMMMHNTTETKLTKTYVRNGRDGGLDVYVGLEWIIEKLFEEDYVCFGYPLRSQNETTYKQLSIGRMRRAMENYQLSQKVLSDQVFLKEIKNNFEHKDIVTPPCQYHYTARMKNLHRNHAIAEKNKELFQERFDDLKLSVK